VGINNVGDDAQAYIQGAGPVTAGGLLNIEADNTSKRIASAGAVAFGVPAAIGGSFGFNDLGDTTKAFVDPGTFTGTDLSVIANSTDVILTVSAGGGASPLGVAVAGSVNVNLITNDTEAFIGDGFVVNASGNVTVRSSLNVSLTSVAGASAISGYVPVGAAIDLDFVNDKSYAYVSGTASVTAGGNVIVIAGAADKILSVASSRAASSVGVAVAGSASYVNPTKDVQGYIGDGGKVHAGGSVTVGGVGQSADVIIDGAGAVGGVGVGVTIAIGNAISTEQAYIGSGASVSAAGNLVVGAIGLNNLAVTAYVPTASTVFGRGVGFA
jgi:hypothetical protein